MFYEYSTSLNFFLNFRQSFCFCYICKNMLTFLLAPHTSYKIRQKVTLFKCPRSWQTSSRWSLTSYSFPIPEGKKAYKSIHFRLSSLGLEQYLANGAIHAQMEQIIFKLNSTCLQIPECGSQLSILNTSVCLMLLDPFPPKLLSLPMQNTSPEQNGYLRGHIQELLEFRHELGLVYQSSKVLQAFNFLLWRTNQPSTSP